MLVNQSIETIYYCININILWYAIYIPHIINATELSFDTHICGQRHSYKGISEGAKKGGDWLTVQVTQYAEHVLSRGSGGISPQESFEN